jgi:hypothetical protein
MFSKAANLNSGDGNKLNLDTDIFTHQTSFQKKSKGICCKEVWDDISKTKAESKTPSSLFHLSDQSVSKSTADTVQW